LPTWSRANIWQYDKIIAFPATVTLTTLDACVFAFEIIKVEENVIKVSVLYPNTAGCKFDMEYYLTRHMPMVQQKLGPACKRMAVEQGIAGGAPGAPATYVAMGHLYFDSTDAFQAAFAPHAQSILADIPNYTDTQPTIQVSEVRL
jgi:uncharacterized protein (TIGR02118 family)